MPFVLVLILPLALVGLFAVLLPISLFTRYRIATSRRRPRGWIVATNIVSLALSATIFLGTAMITGLWVPGAVRSVVAGLAVGGLVGFLGRGLSRWEETPDGLYVTANRWLVLLVSLVVVGRISFGFWRTSTLWTSDKPLVTSDAVLGSAVTGSMAAGAFLVGYSLVYWIGVRVRLRRFAAARSLR